MNGKQLSFSQIAKAIKSLGSGLITGKADDAPSGIATSFKK